MKRKQIFLILIIGVLFSIFSSAYATTYNITTVDEFLALQTTSSENYLGDTINLLIDINLSGESFVPIGSVSYSFAGTFNGNGHSIEGLDINTTNDYQGIFGKLSSTAVVRELIVSGSIKGGNYSGGIAGYNLGTIEKCVNKCDVISNGDCVGGIAGCNEGIIKNTRNSGIIKGHNTTANIGGIAGINVSSSSQIISSLNTGTIVNETESSLKGAIVGNNSGTLSRTYYLSGDTSTGIYNVADVVTVTESKSGGDLAILSAVNGLNYYETEPVWGLKGCVNKGFPSLIIEYTSASLEDKKFITTWEIPTANTTITLPVRSIIYDGYSVEWGDGEISCLTDSFPTHTYAQAGTYDIKIGGTVYFFGCNIAETIDSTTNSEFYSMTQYLTGVKQLGELGTHQYQFAQCANLTSFVSNAQEHTFDSFDYMGLMFRGCTGLTSIDLSEFDTSKVTDLTSLFLGCTGLTNIDLSSFDTTSVTSMSFMFRDCTNLETITFGENFTTANVSGMAEMFRNCSSLENIDVSGFNTSNARDMSIMFSGCSSLTSLDVSGFNTTNVTNMMFMFQSCSSLSNLDLRNFNTSNVQNMQQMFNGLSVTCLDLSSFSTASVTNMNYMFNGSTNLETIVLGKNFTKFDGAWMTGGGDDALKAIIIQSPSAITIGSNGIGGAGNAVFYVLNESLESTYETTYSGILNSSQVEPIIKLIGNSAITEMARSSYTDGGINFAGYVVRPNPDNTITMPASLEDSGYVLSVTNGRIRNPNVGQTITVTYTLKYYNNSTEDLSLANTLSRSVTFTGAVVNIMEREQYADGETWYAIGVKRDGRASLKEKYVAENIAKIVVQDSFDGLDSAVDSWDVSLASDGSVMAWIDQDTYWGREDFYIMHIGGEGRIKTPLYANWQFAKYTNCFEMEGLSLLDTSATRYFTAFFYSDSTVKVLDLTNFDTGVALTFNSMFGDCYSLTSIDVTDFVTTSVTDMQSMFFNCAHITQIDFSSFDTSLVTNMAWMFSDCIALEEIVFGPNFTTESATTIRQMFHLCRELVDIDLSGFDTSNVENMSGLFQECTSLTEIDLSGFDTTSATDISFMFYDCTNLESVTFGSDFTTSGVLNMQQMFMGCNSLESLDLSKFNTTNVTNMLLMFYECTSLTELDLSNFNTTAVTNMNHLFFGCSNLTTIILGPNFNQLNGQNMLNGCSNLERVISMYNGVMALPTTGDGTAGYLGFYQGTLYVPTKALETQYESNVNFANGFGTSANAVDKVEPLLELVGNNTVTVGIGTMYTDDGATVAGFALSSGENITPATFQVSPFEFTLTLDKTHLSTSNVITNANANNPTNYAEYKLANKNGTVFATVKRGVNVAVQIDVEKAMIFDYTLPEPSGDLTYPLTVKLPIQSNSASNNFVVDWGDGTVEGISGAAGQWKSHTYTTNGVKTIKISGRVVGTFGYANKPDADSTDTYYINNFDNTNDMRNYLTKVSQLGEIGVYQYGFSMCKNLLSFTANATPNTFINVKSFAWSFQGCTELTTIDCGNWNTSSVTNFRAMFAQCENLATIDASNWDTSAVTDMKSMFEDCRSLTSLSAANWNTSNVTSMYCMFKGCSSLANISVANWDTSKVTTMQSMFEGCSSLTSIAVNNWNTSEVTSLYSMFKGCSSLASIPVGGWDTSKVENIGSMFDGCSNLISIPVGNWNTSAVNYMGTTFNNCSNLTSIQVNNWNTNLVTSMYAMFNGCSNLVNIPVSGWSTNALTNLNAMFQGCSSLTSLSLDNWNTSSVNDMYSTFRGCSSLESISLNNWNSSLVKNMKYMFFDCSSLTKLDLSSFSTSSLENGRDMFLNCSSLTDLVLGPDFIRIDSERFNGCNSLEHVISMYNGVMILPNYSAGTVGSLQLGHGTLYVPTKAIEDQYEADTNFANAFGTGANAVNKVEPIIVLTGSNPVTVENGSTYTDAGATVAGLALNSGNDITPTLFQSAPFNYELTLDTTHLSTANEITNTDVDNPTNYVEYKLADKNNTVFATVKRGVNVAAQIDVEKNLMQRESYSSGDTWYALGVKRDDRAVLKENYTAANIEKIVIQESFAGMNSALHSWDVSASEDESIMAWTVAGTQTGKYIMYIGGNGTIKAPYWGYNQFSYYTNCEEIEGLNILDTSNVYQFTNFFCGDAKLEEIDVSNFDTSIAVTLNGMFRDCSMVEELDLSGFNTSNVIDMTSLFLNCSALTELDLSSFNTPNIQSTQWMFENCTNLANINFGNNFNTSNVTTMQEMFRNCTSLENIDISGFNTASATNLSHMFKNCSGLETITFGSNFTIGNVQYIQEMFRDCSSLRYLDLSRFNTANVKNMSCLFQDCSSLQTIDLSNFNTANVTDMSHMFHGCTSISSLDLSSFNTSRVQNMQQMFDSMLITELDLSSFSTDSVSNMNYLFSSCANLESIILGKDFTKYNGSWMTGGGINALKAIIIQSPSTTPIVDIGSNGTGGAGNAVFYVLNETLENEYETAYSSILSASKIEPITRLIGNPSVTASVSSAYIDGGINFAGNTVIPNKNGTIDTPSALAKAGYVLSVTNGKISNIEVGTPFTVTYDLRYFDKNSDEDLSLARTVTRQVTFTGSLLTLMPRESYSSGETWYALGVKRDGRDELKENYKAENIEKIIIQNSTSGINSALHSWDVSDNQDESIMAWTVAGTQQGKYIMYIGGNGTIKANYDSSNLFKNYKKCTEIEGLDLLNTSNVHNFSGFFESNLELEEVDISNFDTSNATSMSTMFNECIKLININLSSFNTSNVTNMQKMFAKMTELTSLDLSSFSTASLSNMDYIFNGDKKLEYIILGEDFKKFNGSGMISSDSKLLRHIISLSPTVMTIGSSGIGSAPNTILYVLTESLESQYESTYSSYLTSAKVHPFLELLGSSIVTVPKDYNYIDGGASVAGFDSNTTGDITPILFQSAPFNYLLTYDDSHVSTANYVTNSNLNNATNYVEYTLAKNDGTIIATERRAVNVADSVIDESKAFIMDWTIPANNTRIKLPIWWESGSHNFIVDWGDGKVERVVGADGYYKPHVYETSGVKRIKISGYINGTFGSTSNNNDEDNYWVKSETFRNYLTNVVQLGEIGVSRYYFAGCHNLESFTANATANTFENVTTMDYMFLQCDNSNLTTIDVGNWDMSDITNVQSMFNHCKNLETLDVSHWDTSSITNMYALFGNCEKLSGLDVSDWDVSNVTDMRFMFVSNSALQTIDVSRWNTSSVQRFNSMFSQDWHLTTLDVSGWDTSSAINMSGMFDNCSSLTSLAVSNWDTGSVTDMNNMFKGSRELVNLDVSSWDTSSVTNMESLFRLCCGLTTLDVSGWDTSSVTNIYRMFENCYGLTSIDLSNWDTSSVTNMNDLFKATSGSAYGTTSLESILLGPNFNKLNGQNMFSGCTELQRVISMYDGIMTLPTAGNGTTGYLGLTNGVIYVPTSAIERSYESNSNFSKAFGTGASAVNKVEPMIVLVGDNPVTIAKNSSSYTDAGSTVAGFTLSSGDNITPATFQASPFEFTLTFDTTHLSTANVVTNADTNNPTNYVEYKLADKNNTVFATAKRAVNVQADSNYRVNGVDYERLQEAISAVPTNGTKTTITVLRDVTDGSTATIASTQNIVLDLQNYTVTLSTRRLTNNGTLELKGTGTITTTDRETINSTGTLKIEQDATHVTNNIVSEVAEEHTREVYAIRSYGTFTNTTGIISSNYGVVLVADGTFTMNGGTITATDGDKAIYCVKGVVNIVDGTVNGNVNSIFTTSEASELNITGGIINSNKTGIYNNAQHVTINMSGGEINASGDDNSLACLGIRNHYGTVNISGNVRIVGSNSGGMSYGVSQCFGVTNITGGYIEGGSYGVSSEEYSSYTSIMNISGGTIIGHQYAAVQSSRDDESDDVITITGGTFNGTYGIVNKGGGKVIIGNNDGTVSTSSPAIPGTTYGYYQPSTSNGTFEFYDGVFTGGTKAIYIENTSVEPTIPTGYKIKYENSERTAYLSTIISDTTSLIMTWRVSGDIDGVGLGTTIKLPIPYSNTNNYYVDWGDGSAVENFAGALGTFPTHTYSNSTIQDYIIKIDGTVNWFGYSETNVPSSSGEWSNYYTYTQYLTGVSQLGELSTTYYGFSNCTNLTSYTAVATSNTFNNITSMRNMFFGCTGITNISTVNWNTSKVTSMYGAFDGCSNLTTLSVENWDTSEVENMSFMFDDCNSLSSLSVGNWNTSKVKNMQWMFGNCWSLTSLAVNNWDTSSVGSMFAMFRSCKALTTIPVNNWNVSNVTNLSATFFDCVELTTLPVQNWNTSAVTDMSWLFDQCRKLNTIPVANWNTSNVKNMQNTFYDCQSLISIPVQNWDTSKVTNMTGTFYNCKLLTSIPVEDWNVSSVTSMSGMFQHCSVLNDIDIEKWNVGLTTNVSSMFYSCKALDDIILGPNFKSLNGQNVFYNCTNLERIISMYNGVMTLPSTANGTTGYLGLTNGVLYVKNKSIEADYENNANFSKAFGTAANAVNKVEPIIKLLGANPTTVMKDSTYVDDGAIVTDLAIRNSGDITPTYFKAEPFNFTLTYDTSHLSTAVGITNADINNPTNYVEYTLSRSGDGVLASIKRAIDVSLIQVDDSKALIMQWKISGDVDGVGQGTTIKLPIIRNATNNYVVDWGDGSEVEEFDGNSASFPSHKYSNSSTQSYTIKISGKVPSFGYADNAEPTEDNGYSNYYTFCQYLTKVVQFGELDCQSYSFAFCRKLTDCLANATTHTFDSFNNMAYMFYFCNNLESIDSDDWDVSKVTDMYGTFWGCTKLEEVPATNWNTTACTSMKNMFRECPSLTTIDVSDWNTENVNNLFAMFYHCESLETLDVSDWDTSKVTNMQSLFNGCSKLTSLDVSDWDTSIVTTMDQTFRDCEKLTALDVSNWNTSKVTNMKNMFRDCKQLTSLAVDDWDVSKATDMERMFSGCSKLDNLDVSNWNTEKVETMSYLFYNCDELTVLDLSSWNTNRVNDMGAMFSSSGKLTDILLGSNFNKLDGENMFDGCSELKGIISLNDGVMALPTTANGTAGFINLASGTLYVQTKAIEQAYESNANFANTFGTGTDAVNKVEPILKVKGFNPVDIGIGTTYVDEGALVAGSSNLTESTTSPVFTDFGYSVITTGLPINTSKVGNYTVTYKLQRTVNSVAQTGMTATRTVTVSAHPHPVGNIVIKSKTNNVVTLYIMAKSEIGIDAILIRNEGTLGNVVQDTDWISWDDTTRLSETSDVDTKQIDWALSSGTGRKKIYVTIRDVEGNITQLSYSAEAE